MLNLVQFVLLLLAVGCSAQDATDCSRPPPFVNPHQCCKDPPPSDVAQTCSTKLGVPLRADKPPPPGQTPPDLGAITCFAECVLNESRYLNNGNLDMAAVKTDLQAKFANDPDYIPVMEAAFKKCATIAQHQLAAMANVPSPPDATKLCSPYSGLVLGCAYKEFFENCPTSKWTSSPQCNAVQDYMKKCSKGD